MANTTIYTFYFDLIFYVNKLNIYISISNREEYKTNIKKKSHFSGHSNWFQKVSEPLKSFKNNNVTEKRKLFYSSI